VLFLVIGLFCHHRRQIILPTWRQRRGARTTRLRRSRHRHSSAGDTRVHRIRPNVRDDRETSPLVGPRRTNQWSVSTSRGKQNIFSGKAGQL